MKKSFKHLSKVEEFHFLMNKGYIHICLLKDNIISFPVVISHPLSSFGNTRSFEYTILYTEKYCFQESMERLIFVCVKSRSH